MSDINVYISKYKLVYGYIGIYIHIHVYIYLWTKMSSFTGFYPQPFLGGDQNKPQATKYLAIDNKTK